MSKKIESEIWNLRDLDKLTRLVLVKIADNADEVDGIAWPSVAYLVAHCAMGERTVQRALRELVDCGALVIVENEKGGKGSRRYFIDLDRARDVYGTIDWRQRNRAALTRANSHGKDRSAHQAGENDSVEGGASQAPPPDADGGASQAPPRDAEGCLTGGDGVPPRHPPGAPQAPEPSLNRQGEKKEGELTLPEESAPADRDAQFDDWWSLTPKKVGKGQARIKFRQALKKTDFETLKRGIIRYARQIAGEPPRYIAHPATWLEGERWLDEDPPEGESNGTGHSRDGRRSRPRSPHAALFAAGAKSARSPETRMSETPGPAAEGTTPDEE